MALERVSLENKTILVTGAAGFIGAALTERLLTLGVPLRVVGLDSLNDYYDVRLKEYRLQRIETLAASACPDDQPVRPATVSWLSPAAARTRSIM